VLVLKHNTVLMLQRNMLPALSGWKLWSDGCWCDWEEDI